MSKTIKISEESHKKLEIMKAIHGIKIGEYVSELIEKDVKKRNKTIFSEVHKTLD